MGGPLAQGILGVGRGAVGSGVEGLRFTLRGSPLVHVAPRFALRGSPLVAAAALRAQNHKTHKQTQQTTS